MKKYKFLILKTLILFIIGLNSISIYSAGLDEYPGLKNNKKPITHAFQKKKKKNVTFEDDQYVKTQIMSQNVKTQRTSEDVKTQLMSQNVKTQIMSQENPQEAIQTKSSTPEKNISQEMLQALHQEEITVDSSTPKKKLLSLKYCSLKYYWGEIKTKNMPYHNQQTFNCYPSDDDEITFEDPINEYDQNINKSPDKSPKFPGLELNKLFPFKRPDRKSDQDSDKDKDIKRKELLKRWDEYKQQTESLAGSTEAGSTEAGSTEAGSTKGDNLTLTSSDNEILEAESFFINESDTYNEYNKENYSPNIEDVINTQTLPTKRKATIQANSSNTPKKMPSDNNWELYTPYLYNKKNTNTNIREIKSI